jgi:hypothetical protein
MSACEKHSFWPANTPMKERLRILEEKAIYCPYCGKLRTECPTWTNESQSSESGNPSKSDQNE